MTESRSKVKQMWLLALFDLPVKTKTDRRNYVKFRKELIRKGFWMMQFSVYARPCQDRKQSQTYMRQIKRILPITGGQVRIIEITEKQFSDMKIYESRIKKPPEEGPEQLLLF